MNLSRISKKVPHADSRETLISMHENKLREFEEYYAQLPEKKLLLDRLKEKALSLPREVNSLSYSEKQNERILLEEQINNLGDEIEKMESREEELDYILKSASYLQQYYEELKYEASSLAQPQTLISQTETQMEREDDDEYESDDDPKCVSNIESFVETSQISQKGRICEEYIYECLGEIPKSKRENKINLESLVCQDCNVNRILVTSDATAVCPECGNCIRYQDSQTHTEFSEEVEILSPFAYKRINHFKEWLNSEGQKSILLSIFSLYTKINSCGAEVVPKSNYYASFRSPHPMNGEVPRC